MKIKVIDLLNMISKGEEVPRKIKYNNKIYEYTKEIEWYLREDLKGELFIDKNRLNDEAEIIEEDKKIEKLENETKFYNYAEYEKRCDIDKVLYILKAINLTEEKIDNLNNKINELIDAVNGSTANYQKKFRR